MSTNLKTLLMWENCWMEDLYCCCFLFCWLNYCKNWTNDFRPILTVAFFFSHSIWPRYRETDQGCNLCTSEAPSESTVNVLGDDTERVNWPMRSHIMETQTVKQLERSPFTPKDSCMHARARALAGIHTGDNHYSLRLKGAEEPFTKLCLTNTHTHTHTQ